MKITEKILLEGYQDVCADGITAISKIGRQEIRWTYRRPRTEDSRVITGDRERADDIMLEYDRAGDIPLDDDLPLELLAVSDNHAMNCRKVWGDQVLAHTSMKNFKPSADMIRAAENCFAAMAFTETIRPIVEAYHHKILEEEKYPYSPKMMLRHEKAPADWISNLQHTYMLGEDDAKHYYKRCNEERIKAGLHVDDPAYCPLLVAEHLQMQAEHALIDAMEPVTHITRDMIWEKPNALENLKKLLDLTLRFMAAYCDAKGTMRRFGIAA